MSKLCFKGTAILSLFLFIHIFFSDINVSAINFSTHSMNISLGKKVILKPNGCSSNVSWSTNNTAIATVSRGGMVNTIGVGRVLITARDMNNNSVDNFILNVAPKEPVRFAYVTPNTCTPNTEVSIYATTECYIEAMRFDIEHNGRVFSVPAIERFVEGNVHVWRGKFNVSDLGIYNVRSYSCISGGWYTCDDGTTEVLAKNMTNKSECTYGERRVSDEGLNFISSCEGFSSEIYKDPLCNKILSLGYGYVVRPYVPFYTGISRREGRAMLIRTINKGQFSTNVNKFLTQNNIMFSQQQFDALVSFTYNLGSGWIYKNCGLRNVLLNVGSDRSQYIGTVQSSNGINIRNGPSIRNKIIGSLRNNVQVEILDCNKINTNWYKIKTMNNVIGYCCSDYLRLSERVAGVKSLNNVNRTHLINNLLLYHHVSGKCYKGLLTRRLWELDMFLYGEYGINGRYSSRYSNRHQYPLPSCCAK